MKVISPLNSFEKLGQLRIKRALTDLLYVKKMKIYASLSGTTNELR